MKKKTDVKHEIHTHICALDREICQLRKDENWDAKLLEKFFSYFAKKIWLRIHLSNC